MQIRGRRITIAGSAARDADPVVLNYAHALTEQLVTSLLADGALFSAGVGKEPRRMEDFNQPAIIFDWTVLEALGNGLKDGRTKATTPQGHLLATITTSKTSSQIPESRQNLWTELVESQAVLIRSVEPGWTSGAIRRQMQTELGDILIAISGGEGVEHLAKEFALQGKPVIPLDLQLGSSSKDGTGGAAKLFGQMRAHPERFINLTNPSSAGALLTQLETGQGKTPSEQVVTALIGLIKALRPPKAFYVRLLNNKMPDYAEVEGYFRHVVDKVVSDFGYEIIEMGKAVSSSAWMDVQIFEMIHNAGVVIVDLTGVRPNCFTEMGYAFGRGRKVLITAKEGTAIPFDTSTVEARLWSPAKSAEESVGELQLYWQRNIDRPPLVNPKNII